MHETPYLSYSENLGFNFAGKTSKNIAGVALRRILDVLLTDLFLGMVVQKTLNNVLEFLFYTPLTMYQILSIPEVCFTDERKRPSYTSFRYFANQTSRWNAAIRNLL